MTTSSFQLPNMDALFKVKPAEPAATSLASPLVAVDFTSKLALLADQLAGEGSDLELLKYSLKELKSYLVAEPTMVATLLPEQIGLLIQALFKTTSLRIVEDAKPKVSKPRAAKGSKGMAKFEQIDPDNIPF